MNPTPVALLTYADTPVPYGLNSYAVRAVYGMNESLNAGPVVINAVPMLHSVNDVTISNGMTGCYNATQTIAVAGNGTTFNVEAGGSATMIAGQNIQYFPGTTVGDGGYMWGYIAPAGPFCTIPTLPVAASAGENPTADPAISSFRIYPNPTNGTFRLMPGDALTQENTRVEIFSIWGEKVVQQTFSLSGMPAGVYFIRVIRGNHAATGKIVKR
jgi:hypothetical protein